MLKTSSGNTPIATAAYITHIVRCLGVVQLGGSDPWYNQGGHAKVGARKSFLFTAGSLIVKNFGHAAMRLRGHVDMSPF